MNFSIFFFFIEVKELFTTKLISYPKRGVH